ncbi:MAG: histidinol dehydrogenase, partial [Streptococcus sp.]|nr:histidinol dehydrogenase [Streptococcus sp.]
MKIYKESLEAMLAIVRNYTQQTTDMEIERRVYDIIADVRTNSDAALKAYSEKFDGVSIENFRVSQEEIDAAYESLSDDLKAALLKAKANITEFHSREIE